MPRWPVKPEQIHGYNLQSRVRVLHKESWQVVSGLGDRVRKERVQMGLSTQQLATLARVSKSKIICIENATNRGGVSSGVLFRISQALGVKSDYLLGLSMSKTPHDWYPKAHLAEIAKDTKRRAKRGH
jgi:transcriptional regulator with XRE-family HTH domain